MVAALFISALLLAGIALGALANGIVERSGRHITALSHAVLFATAGALALLLLVLAVMAL